MSPAPEFHRVSDDLHVWQAYEPAVKVDCTSTAVRTPEGFLLVDPIAISPEALETLLEGEKPVAIALTSGNHQRFSRELRAQLAIPILAPADAQGEVEADRWFADGEVLCETLQAIRLPGAAPGEVALLGRDLLVMGDALINLGELAILPAKYCEDSRQLVRSLQRLTTLDFYTLCFAHGLPLTVRACDQVAALLSGA